jgi:hypothetical protein
MKPNNFPRLTLKLSLQFHDVPPRSNRLFLSFGGQSLRTQVPRAQQSGSGSGLRDHRSEQRRGQCFQMLAS